MLVREQPATELTIATRILARAGALGGDRRITLRLKDVMYIGGRGVALATMTPYDVAVVLVSDGATLHGLPPSDTSEYLDMHRRSPQIASVARMADVDYVCAATLRGCVVAALRRARGEDESTDEATIEAAWLELVSQARISGALIGAFPTENEAP
jgi:ribulose-5-phosphate 4-epimerase/fuculose-1-phosphate aldolase